MNRSKLFRMALFGFLFFSYALLQAEKRNESRELSDGAIVKKILDTQNAGVNLLRTNQWRAWQKGYDRKDDLFLCDNGQDGSSQRGASQTVVLNQTRPEPILATAWSKAEDVGGSRDSDYSLYLDLLYTDGTPLWGQMDSYHTGSHDWQQARVLVFPEKPVRSVAFHMLLRNHAGKAWFRDPELRVVQPSGGSTLFDGVAVSLAGTLQEGFQLRDVAANTDFVAIHQEALGIRLEYEKQTEDDATFFDATIQDLTGKDRAMTLLYAVPMPREDCLWFHDPQSIIPVHSGREYCNTATFRVGSNGRLSRYPFGAVADKGSGIALGIDMSRPAFFRTGYNTDTEELFLSYDVGLTPEKSQARVRFCMYRFQSKWGFRAALAKYYLLFPEHFTCRIPEQGLWMPFAKISDVPGWQDYGFRFKEGTNETAWDDAHNIITFRYTEPMTWWMSMPAEMPRTIEAALTEAQRLANVKKDIHAKALLTSGYHDEKGEFVARLLDTPWCNGAVWSINSMPSIPGEITDFKNKWNDQLQRQLYGSQRKTDLDGEYIDSSEGYVTDELDFRRDHFAAAQTPLTFSLNDHKPAIFRGLIAFEYVQAISKDIHGQGKFMMANSTPIRLCWLAPWLDVMGSETNWNPNKTWQPMSTADLLYRRAMCGTKPYCFLMNTPFEDFSHEKVEKYMKRCLAFGMFPGFFSHNASQGHYFTRPELYERDRPLFKKYIPLCKRVAEAGWTPIPLARSNDSQVFVEQFGQQYVTVYNDSSEPRQAVIELQDKRTEASRELVHLNTIHWIKGRAKITLEGEDVAVIELTKTIPEELKDAFSPAPEYEEDFGKYSSPLRFSDGNTVQTKEQWQHRRKEIVSQWEDVLGHWPPLIEKPTMEYLEKTRHEKYIQHKVHLEIAPKEQTVDGYLLLPDGQGPFPAVLIVYYDAETGVGLGKEDRDFGRQLARQGFVVLSIGTPDFCSLKAPYKPLYDDNPDEVPWQPLSALAYVAANCHTAMANLPQVDPARIGVMGHSYGGKWALFASCLYEKFACAVWSDPGIVFDESRPNVNYWEPWYLGYERNQQRQRGFPDIDNPRTGAYKLLVEQGRDLHELHVLMAPRPFLVSGGSEDPPERWIALNHSIAVNRILEQENKMAMTHREGHSPTPESNAQIVAFFQYVLQ
ncbi:MAG: prolyl oligopeptidase family serine peptidase [Sedimentisphaerales bacterium]|nr:prolyl oligopeptidase family serine peptidase [Sedimentisphaerales bacterium]